MKPIKFKIIILTIIALFAWLAIYSIQPLWWSFMDFTRPHYQEEVEKSLEAKNLSNRRLLKIFQGRSGIHASAAANILAERKSVDTIVPLINIVKKSRNDYARSKSIGLLRNFYGDLRVKQFLVEIVRQGRKDPNYINAMRALSAEHNNEIYPEILKMAKDNYETSYVVGMLGYYPEKPETIEVLTKIANADPEEYVREKAKKALEKIRASQGK